MFSFSQLSRCTLSVALTAGLAVDVVASEFTRERAASAMYGKTPAAQRTMLSERAAVTAAHPSFRMPPPAVMSSGRLLPRPDFAGRAGHPVRPMPPGMPMSARAARQFGPPARFQRPFPAPAFNPRPETRHTAARMAQYRQSMPPPAPMWARAPQPPVALARYQRPFPAPAFNPRPATQHTAARMAQYRQPMRAPAPMWARAPRPPAALARYQRPFPAPAFNPRPVSQNTAARLAQYRQPMRAPAPMWARAPRPPVAMARYQRPLPAPAFNPRAPRAAARMAQYRPLVPPMWDSAPRQLTAYPSSPSDINKLQAQNSESVDTEQASETAEIAAFESSPSDTVELQAEKADSKDLGQAIESTRVEAPVAEVPPLLARPFWMKTVTDGS
ncbi:MAG: hypothetical protein WBN43_11825 [Thiogranum sp.]